MTPAAHQGRHHRRSWSLATLLFCIGLIPIGQHAPAQTGSEPAATAAVRKTPYSTRVLRGRVVWLAEALTRRFDIVQVPEAARKSLALETREGTLIPLAEDIRGRGFRRDARLREMNVELMVRIYHQSPVAQIVRVYSIEKRGKFEVDYWCDICAIAMYELKPCECCQAKIELRKRPVAPSTRR